MFMFNIIDDKNRAYEFKSNILCHSFGISLLDQPNEKTETPQYSISLNESEEDQVSGGVSELLKRKITSSKVIIMMGGRAFPNDIGHKDATIVDVINMSIARLKMIYNARNSRIATVDIHVYTNEKDETIVNGTIVGYPAH